MSIAILFILLESSFFMHLRFSKKESGMKVRTLGSKLCFEFGCTLMRSTSTRMNENRLVSDGIFFVDDVMQDMKDVDNLQTHFVRAIYSAVPFGLVGRVQVNESKHVFNLFDLIVEFVTKAHAGACFSKFKEKYASRNSKGGEDKNAFRGNLKVKSKTKRNKLK